MFGKTKEEIQEVREIEDPVARGNETEKIAMAMMEDCILQMAEDHAQSQQKYSDTQLLDSFQLLLDAGSTTSECFIGCDEDYRIFLKGSRDNDDHSDFTIHSDIRACLTANMDKLAALKEIKNDR